MPKMNPRTNMPVVTKPTPAPSGPKTLPAVPATDK
jgi:hypothetical protein